MKEIGGYQDIERYYGTMLHEDGLKLDCGRNCLAYLIEAKKIKRIWMPCFICDSVTELCEKHGAELLYYHVGLDFKPAQPIPADPEAWLYLVNYYGQLTADEIRAFRDACKNVIVDNAQAYFDDPVADTDTLYTCRKFFGVADGGVLYTDTTLGRALDKDESFEHMTFLAGRYERSATEFYPLMLANNKRFQKAPVRRMSLLTENLLRSFDYADIKRRRTENYRFLHSRLGQMNQLRLREIEGAFAYPLMIENASAVRKYLIENKVYVPTLWPNVSELSDETTTDYRLAYNVLPLPCDQRYGQEEMQYMTDLILKV